jgi:hypothetical protein
MVIITNVAFSEKKNFTYEIVDTNEFYNPKIIIS